MLPPKRNWCQLFECVVVTKDTALVVAVSLTTEECLDERFIVETCFYPPKKYF